MVLHSQVEYNHEQLYDLASPLIEGCRHHVITHPSAEDGLATMPDQQQVGDCTANEGCNLGDRRELYIALGLTWKPWISPDFGLLPCSHPLSSSPLVTCLSSQ